MESGSFDALVERVRFALPELLTLNQISAKPLQLRFISERKEQVAL
jgi:hypothetical protein